MLDELSRWFFDSAGLTPHGFCLLWEPRLIWLLAVSDAVTGFTYFTIPFALMFFVKQRRDLAFRPVFWLFAAFIVLCGTGHWLDLLTLWVPAYGFEGLIKAATACVSLLTASALWTLMPEALSLPSPRQLREANIALSERATQLSRLNDELEQFAYVASHDLKAPVHAIVRLAGWIKEDIQAIAEPEILDNLDLMQQRALRLEMLIASLLNYARVCHPNAAVEAVDLGSMVNEIISSIAPPPGFLVRFQGEAATLLTQRVPLEHVLRNLITNAIKHHDRQEGEVTVSVRMTGDQAEFRVEDDGPGIAPVFHRRIFAIFQTLQSRDDKEASGVGLSIALKAVARAGGKIWVESMPPRRGSNFLFTWPNPNQPEPIGLG